MNTEVRNAERETATQLLLLVWKGIPPKWKGKYHKTIWTQFLNRVRIAASENTVSRFVERLCESFTIKTLPAGVLPILNGLDEKLDDSIMRLFEKEALILVAQTK